MTIQADVQTLEPGAVVELYELDIGALGGAVLRFHAHLTAGSIWWNGFEYAPWPIQGHNFSRTSSGQAAPTIDVGNVDGSITALCMAYDDLVGAKFTRHRTLAKYLDVANFPAGPEKVLNGSFDTDLSGWTIVVGAGGSVTWDTGRLNITAAGVICRASYLMTGLVVGATYSVGFTVATAGVNFLVGTTNTGGQMLASSSRAPGTYSGITFVATQDTAYLNFNKTAAGTAYLDGVSCRIPASNPTADPTQEMPPEVWYVERKVVEEKNVIQFELASGMDLNGMQLPRRQIVANKCLWLTIGGYRGTYCNYTGGAVAKADGTPTSILAEDKCGGHVADCKLRFGANGQLNHGGFPAAGLIR